MRVFAFTAAATAEAFVNGVSLGVVNISAFGIADFGAVPFAPGNHLTAVSCDAAGAAVAVTTVLTAGASVAVRVTVETDGGSDFAADGADVAVISIAVVDAAGALVPSAGHLVTVSVAGGGDVYALANGDPADHTPGKVGLPDLPYGGVWARPAFHGLLRAYVQTRAGAPGAVRVSATADGLEAGSATFVTA